MPRTTLTQYLADHPDSANLVEAVRHALDRIGPTTEFISTSQIAFRRRRTVARVWAPWQYLSGDVAPLVLTLAFPGPVPSPRWKEIIEPRSGQFVHHLELRHPDDVDREVQAWLEQAWQLDERSGEGDGVHT